MKNLLDNMNNTGKELSKKSSLRFNGLKSASCGYGTQWQVRDDCLVRVQWVLLWSIEPGLLIHQSAKTHRLDSGSLLLISPNTAIRKELSKPVELFYSKFNLGIPYDFMRERVFRVALTKPLSGFLNDLVEMLGNDADARQRQLTFDLDLRALIFTVLSEISRHVQWPGLPSDSRITNVLHSIEGDARSISNAELAEIANMSESAFSRLFKRQIGQSPQAYVMDRRMQKAAEQLLSAEDTIEEIAERYGFCDRGHFSRIFKSKYGIGPGGYRGQFFHHP